MAAFKGWSTLGGSGAGGSSSFDTDSALGISSSGSVITPVTIETPKMPSFGTNITKPKAPSNDELKQQRLQYEEAAIQANAQRYLEDFKAKHPEDQVSVQKQEEDYNALINTGIDADLATNVNFVNNPDLVRRQKTAIVTALDGYIKSQKQAVHDASTPEGLGMSLGHGLDTTWDASLIATGALAENTDKAKISATEQEMRTNEQAYQNSYRANQSLANKLAPDMRSQLEHNVMAPEEQKFKQRQGELQRQLEQQKFEADFNKALRDLAIVEAINKTDANEAERLKNNRMYQESVLRDSELQNDPNYDYMVGITKNNHKFFHIAKLVLENMPQLAATVAAGTVGGAVGGGGGAAAAMALMNYGQSIGGIGQQVIQSVIDADQDQMDKISEYSRLKQWAIDHGQGEDKADKFARVSIGMQAAAEHTGTAIAPALVSTFLGPEALLAKEGLLNKFVQNGIVKSVAGKVAGKTAGKGAAATAGATAGATVASQGASAIARTAANPTTKLQKLENWLLNKPMTRKAGGLIVASGGEGLDEVTENAASIHIANQALGTNTSLLDGWLSNFALGALLGGIYGSPALRRHAKSQTTGAPQSVSFGTNQSSGSAQAGQSSGSTQSGTAPASPGAPASVSGLASADPKDIIANHPSYQGLKTDADKQAAQGYAQSFGNTLKSIRAQTADVTDANIDGALATQLDNAIQGIASLFPNSDQFVDNALDVINKSGTNSKHTVSLTRDGIRKRALAYQAQQNQQFQQQQAGQNAQPSNTQAGTQQNAQPSNAQANAQTTAQPNAQTTAQPNAQTTAQANTQQNTQPNQQGTTTVGAPQSVSFGSEATSTPVGASTPISARPKAQTGTDVTGAEVNQNTGKSGERSNIDNILSQEAQQRAQQEAQAQQYQPAQYPPAIVGDTNANGGTDQGLSPANSSATGTQQGNANAVGQQNFEQVAGSYQTTEGAGTSWSPYENAGATSSDVQSSQSENWWPGQGNDSGRSGAEDALTGTQSDLRAGSTASQAEQRTGNSANAEAISPDDAQRIAVDTARAEAYQEIRRDIERENEHYTETVHEVEQQLMPDTEGMSEDERQQATVLAKVNAQLYTNIQATLRSIFESNKTADTALDMYFAPDIENNGATRDSYDSSNDSINYTYSADTPFVASHELLHATLSYIRSHYSILKTAAETNPQARELLNSINDLAQAVGITPEDLINNITVQRIGTSANGAAQVTNVEEHIATAFENYVRGKWSNKALAENGYNRIPQLAQALARAVTKAFSNTVAYAQKLASQFVAHVQLLLKTSPAFSGRLRDAVTAYETNKSDTGHRFIHSVATLIRAARRATPHVDTMLTSQDVDYNVPDVLSSDRLDPKVSAFFDLITNGVPAYGQGQYNASEDARLRARAVYDVATAHRAASLEAQGMDSATALKKAHEDVLTVMRRDDAEAYAKYVAQEATERASVLLDETASDPVVSATINSHIQANPNERAKASIVGLAQASIARLVKQHLPASWGSIDVHWASNELTVSASSLQNKIVDSLNAKIYADFINGNFEQYLSNADRTNPEALRLVNASQNYQALADQGKYQQAVRDYVNSKIAPVVRSYCQYIDPSIKDANTPINFANAISAHSKAKLTGATSGMSRLQAKLYTHVSNTMRSSESFADDVAHCAPDVAIQCETDLAVMQAIQTMADQNAIPVNASTISLAAHAVNAAKPIELAPQTATSPEVANLTNTKLDDAHIAVAAAVQTAVRERFGKADINVHLDNHSTVLDVLSSAINDNWDAIAQSKSWNGMDIRNAVDTYSRADNAKGKSLLDIANWFDISTPTSTYVMPDPALMPVFNANSLSATEAAAVRFVKVVNELYATVRNAVHNELVQRDAVRSDLENQRFTWSQTDTRAGAEATAGYIEDTFISNGMPAPVASAVAEHLVQRAQTLHSLPSHARDEAVTTYITNQFGQIFRTESDLSVMMSDTTGTSSYAIHLASSDLDLMLAGQGILQPEVEVAMEANTPTQELIDSASNPDSRPAEMTEVQEVQARDAAADEITQLLEAPVTEQTATNPALDINNNEELKQWFSVNGIRDADGNPQVFYLNGASLTTEPVAGGTNVQTYARATNIGNGKSTNQKHVLALFRAGKTEEAQQFMKEHTKVDAIQDSHGTIYVANLSNNTSWWSNDKGQAKAEQEQVTIPAPDQETVTEGAPQEVSLNSESEPASVGTDGKLYSDEQWARMSAKERGEAWAEIINSPEPEAERVSQPAPKRKKPVDSATLQDLMADADEAFSRRSRPAPEPEVKPEANPEPKAETRSEVRQDVIERWKQALEEGNDTKREAIERGMTSKELAEATGVGTNTNTDVNTEEDADTSLYIISGDEDETKTALRKAWADVVDASNGSINPDAFPKATLNAFAGRILRVSSKGKPLVKIGEALTAINEHCRNKGHGIADDAVMKQFAQAVDDYINVAYELSRAMEMQPSGDIKYARSASAQPAGTQANAQQTQPAQASGTQQAQATNTQQVAPQSNATLQQQIADRIKAQHDFFKRKADEYANSTERAASETIDTLPPMEAGLWHRFARKVREQFVDSTAMFRSWMQLNASPVVGDAASHPAYMAFANARERVQGARVAIQERVLSPVQDYFKGVAKDMGLDDVVVATELGKARSMLHILEATERRHMELQQNLMSVYMNPNSDPVKQQKALKKAEDELKDFEAAQNGQTVHNDNTGADEPLMKIPGGMTAAKAKTEYEAIVKKYGEDRVRESVERMGQAYDALIQYGIEQGAYSQNDIANFGNWQYYCPLADKAGLEHGIVNDVVDLSPELAEKVGIGSKLPAVDSYTALAHMTYRMANCVGTLDLGSEMVALHKRMAEAYNNGTPGISMSNFSIANAKGTYYNGLIIMPAAQLMHIRDNVEKTYNGDLSGRAKTFLDNAAFYARVQEPAINPDGSPVLDANGNPVMQTRTYAVAFNENDRYAKTHDANGNIVDADLPSHKEEHDALRSMFTPQKQSKARKIVGSMTSGLASLNTTYKPFFPPINTVRDYFERALFTAGKIYRDANGNAVDRSKIAAGFTKNMLHGPAVMKSVLTGKTDVGGELGQYLTEFKELGIMSSTSLRALLASNEKMSYAFLQEMITRVEKGEDAKTVWKQLSKKHKQFRGMMHTYSEMWYAIPIFATYKTMRENGMSKRDAQYYATEIANMSQRGKLGNGWMGALWPFTTSIGQSAAQLADFFGLGSMAFGQGEKSKQYRKRAMKNYAITTGVALSVSMFLPAIATALGDGDDEEGQKILDRMGLSSFTALPIPLGSGGEYYKLPLGFGVVPLATQMAVGFDRIQRGVDTVPHVMSELLCSFTSIMSPVGGPTYETHSAEELAIKMLNTFVPSPVQGLAEMATNRDFWGNQIRKGYPQDDVRASDSGALRTPGFWKDLAKGIYENTNGSLDIAPESLRALASSYLQGPFQAVYAWLDNDPFVKDPMYENTRATLGPALTLMGATSVYSAAPNLPRRDMYEFSNECDEFIRKAGLHDALVVNSVVNPKTGKQYTAAEKRYDALIMAGVDQAYAEDFVRSYTMQRQLLKDATAYRKKIESAMAAGATSDMIQQLNDERWIKEQVYVEAEQKLMNYNNGVYRRGTIPLPDPELVKYTLATLGGE